MRAWCRGDFDGCLVLCDLVDRRRPDLALEIALLRTRALLRLQRAAEALAAIERARLAAPAADGALTARMLLGTAYVRLGRIDEGIAVLDGAGRDAEAAGAHPAIRSEIALAQALAHYGRRDLDAADAALDRVWGAADIIFARALEYRAWIAMARGDYRVSMTTFRAAVEHLDRCRYYDRFLEANALITLSAFAVEMLDRELWQFVQARAGTLDWSASGLAEARFWIAMAQAYMEELDGRNAAAIRAARAAEELAPSAAYRVHARLRRAAITRFLGEAESQHDHVASAAELFGRLEPDTLAGAERNVALTLAEELAHVGAVEDAREALRVYRAHRLISPMFAAVGDRRAYAYERLVEAEIAEAAGELVEAHHGYRDAFQAFRAIGYRRRALVAALRLAEIADQTYLYEYVAREVREFAESSWFRRRVLHRHAAAVAGQPGVG